MLKKLVGCNKEDVEEEEKSCTKREFRFEVRVGAASRN
jgi:hypothetical protein